MKSIILIILLLFSGCASRYPDYTMYQKPYKKPDYKKIAEETQRYMDYEWRRETKVGKRDNIAKEAVKATNEKLKSNK